MVTEAFITNLIFWIRVELFLFYQNWDPSLLLIVNHTEGRIQRIFPSTRKDFHLGISGLYEYVPVKIGRILEKFQLSTMGMFHTNFQAIILSFKLTYWTVLNCCVRTCVRVVVSVHLSQEL